MTSPTPNWVNVKDNGAMGDGVTDDTAAIQAVLTAAESNTMGTVVYFPAGIYMVDNLTYSSAAPLVLKGDTWSNLGWTPCGSNIQANAPATSTSPLHILELDNAISVTVEDLGVLGAQTATSAYTNDYVGISFAGAYYVHMVRCYVGHNVNGNLVNTGIKTDSGVKNFFCDDYSSATAVNGYWMDGSIQVSFRNANMGTTAGAGGAAFYMTNGAGTLRATNCQTDRGDRGLWMSSNGGNAPAFVFFNDVEFNNYAISGMQLDEGSQVYVNQGWFSGVGVTPFPANAIDAGSGFSGDAIFSQCTFQGHSQGTVTLSGGSGYIFTGCIWGYEDKLAANTYDELHIGGTVSNVSVTACHFNVDPWYGPGNVTARSAIWTASTVSNVGVCNCICASSGDYGGGAGHGGDTGIGVWTGNLGPWT